MKINNVTYSNRAQTTTKITKETENILNTSAVQFLESTPIIVDYYQYDVDKSTVGVGFRDTGGPFSGATKYKYIKDYIMYGFNDMKEVNKDLKEENDLQYDVAENQSLHLPNTIHPREGDLITLKIENNKIFYRIVEVKNASFHNNPYILTTWVLEKNLPHENYTLKDMEKDGLISDKFRFISDNVGTEYTCFLRYDFYDNMSKLELDRFDINEEYMDYFYDEEKNLLYNINEDILNSRDYFPILVDFQMKYFPLKVFKENDLMLTHETIINTRNITNFKKSHIRRFIDRHKDNLINEGIKFKKWTYTGDTLDPRYKVQSWLNDKKFYNIYDYGEGEVVSIPDDTMKEIFTKYCDNTLTLNYLVEVLDDYAYNIELSKEYLLYIPVLLEVIDIFMEESMKVTPDERYF